MRTRTYWNGIIDAALAPLGLSSSAVAEWKLQQTIAVTIAMALDGFMQIFYKDIDVALSTKQFGTVPWYGVVGKAFQYGDSLAVTDGVLYYSVIDTTKQIVTHCSARELDDEVVSVKAAKTVSGSLAKLSTPELTAFTNYMKRRRAPGAQVNIVSADPDQVEYVFDVLFDARVDQAGLAAAIDAALLVFRDNFDNPDFDSTLYKAQMVKKVMDIDGVKDVTGPVTIYPAGGGSIVLEDYEEVPAGYFNWKNTSTITLSAAP